MASESTEERAMSVTIPAELDDWLEEQAASLDVDRETLLVQLLVTFQRTTEYDGDLGNGYPVSETVGAQLEEGLSTAIEESLTERIREQVNAHVQETVETLVTRQLSQATDSVQRQLDTRIESVEDDYMEKIQDVRERVIQVKKETDAKASADHTHEEFALVEELHEEFERVEELATEIESLREEFEQLETEYTEAVREHGQQVETFDERLDTVEDRLKTVAWVVSDLREAHESGGGLRAVERIKRAAAKNDIERANCENCGERVVLALLTDPECPHCNVTVTNVEPAGGWFGKPKLRIASQLESGE